MKRIFAIVACALLLLTGCSLQKSDGRKHLFWKVCDSNSCVYLLGSLHFADSSFYPLDSIIEKAFERSEELVVEIDVSNDSILREISLQSEKYGMLQGGMTLGSILPKDLAESLDSICDLWDLPEGFFDHYTPWSAAMTINALGIMRLGYDGNLGIDVHFLRQARESGKKIVSLESVEDQIAALTGQGVPDSVGVLCMRIALREVGLLDSATVGMMRAWKAGDDSLFRETMSPDTAQLDAVDSLLKREIDERIYLARNRKMADAMAGMITENRKVFVVVGAGHLVGEGDNVLDILRRKGFAVEQL